MNKAIFLLQDLDFSESEAKAYITLLKTGAVTGYELSKQSGVARSKIYNILEQLREKGAVLVSKQSDPVLYSAIPSEELVKNYENNLKQKLAKIDDELCQFKNIESSEELWYIKGYQNIMNRCRYLIEQAEESVLIQMWSDEKAALYDALLAFENRGGACAAIYYDESGHYDLDLANVYEHGFEEAMLKENKGQRWINLVVDEKTLVFGHLNDQKHVEVLWTQHQPMVFLAKENIRHDVYCLRLLEMLDENQRAQLGENMLGIKKLFNKGEKEW